MISPALVFHSSTDSNGFGAHFLFQHWKLFKACFERIPVERLSQAS
jgi:hypothetical protein